MDSSVILDVVLDDPSFADASEAALRKASAEGQLVICECVLAEIRPAFESSESLEEFLADWQFHFSPSTEASAQKAGEYLTHYLERGGKSGRILPDFLIGAHALVHTERLVARDRGYLRDYFTELTVVDPSAS